MEIVTMGRKEGWLAKRRKIFEAVRARGGRGTSTVCRVNCTPRYKPCWIRKHKS